MATIRAFRAIKPHAIKAAELIKGVSLKQRLEQPIAVWAEHDELTGLHDHIAENLRGLLQDGSLELSNSDAFYIYEIFDGKDMHTGLWTLTSFQDVLNGRIKKHELTLREDAKYLKNYRQQARLDASPVLIAYQSDDKIEGLINMVKKVDRPVMLIAECKQYYIWKVAEEHLINLFTEAFARLGTVYLADGHHRTDAVGSALEEKYGKSTIPEHDPEAWFSTIYIPTEQLQIEEYFRMFTPEKPIDREWLFKMIRHHFDMIPAKGNLPVGRCKPQHFGMFFEGVWYELKAKESVLSPGDLIDSLDVSVLHRYILEPALGVTDSRNDKRLSCIGGPDALSIMLEKLNNDNSAIGFTLCPVSINQLISVAYTDNVMPPKSTWIGPKIPFGLMMYKF